MMEKMYCGSRWFLGIGALVFAMADTTSAQSGDARSASLPEGNTTERPYEHIKQINAGELNVGYVESGPADGAVVLLLHGWPYDIHSYEDVVPRLTARGFRVIVPYIRGFGTTRFLSEKTFRNGQQSVLAADMIAFMDAMQIRKAIVAGFDWGARTADIMAALWPERCLGLVSVSGYLIINRQNNLRPLQPKAELAWWYQYYFSTERGRSGYDLNRREFNKLIWQLASPKWDFNDATYDRSAASFNNSDHVAVVIHNYRWRLSMAAGDPKYDEVERKLSAGPPIRIPTITIGSDFDGTAKDGAAYSGKFTGKYHHKVLNGIGHNVPQEAPEEFAQAVLEVAALAGIGR
jgi:pimeloyl-ACP methyl ester carboxylesterase